MARLGARIRKGTMETMKTLGTAAVARSPMTPVTNVAKAFSVPGMLQSPTVGQGLKTTNGNMVRLGDVCHILNGYAFRSEKYVCSGVRIIRIANVQKGYVEDSSPVFYPLDNNELYKYELFEDDLLMSLTGNVGRVALLQKEFLPAALNQRVACLRIKDETVIGKRFLFNFLNSDYFETKCIESSKGAAQKNMSTEWLKNYEVPLFSFEEQEKISSELDKISHLIALRKRQLSKLDELVKSRFVEMFGDPVSNPKKWNVCRIREFADVRIGPFGSLLHKEDYIQGGHPLVNPSHMINGKIVPDNDLTLSESKYKELGVYKLRPNDIVIARRGEIGRCALVESEGFFCGTGSMFVRIIKDCRADYLQRVISYPTFAARLEDAAVGITMKNINAGMIENCLVPLPPLALQREFAAFVEKVDKLEFKAKASLEKLETLKKAMMQKYFN